MAIQTPEYLQTKTYSAKKDRRVQQAEVMQEGIVDFGHYKVTQRGAGANMSVDVAAGEAWVDGDTSAEQGFYHVVNDAVVNVAISAASAANPRIDTLVLAVNDSTEIGGSDEFKLEVIAGTPTASASLSNLSGVGAVGATKLVLAYILVGKEVTSITTEKIGGKRDWRAGTTGYPAVIEPKAVTGSPPQYAHGRPLSYVPACKVYNSAAGANTAETPVSFNAEVYDLDEMHSTSENTSRVICKTPGTYQFNACLYASAAGIYYVKHTFGASTEQVGNGTNAGGAQICLAGQIRMGYGDYIELLNSPLSTFTTVGKTMPSLQAVWQGP